MYYIYCDYEVFTSTMNTKSIIVDAKVNFNDTTVVGSTNNNSNNRNNIDYSSSINNNNNVNNNDHKRSINNISCGNAPSCNCRVKSQCPLIGWCLIQNVIHKCTIVTEAGYFI